MFHYETYTLTSFKIGNCDKIGNISERIQTSYFSVNFSFRPIKDFHMKNKIY